MWRYVLCIGLLAGCSDNQTTSVQLYRLVDDDAPIKGYIVAESNGTVLFRSCSSGDFHFFEMDQIEPERSNECAALTARE